MKHLTKPTRRLLAALLAVATVLGVLVPVTLPTAGAKSLAEYEQEAYFRNGECAEAGRNQHRHFARRHMEDDLQRQGGRSRRRPRLG